jgi:deoxyribodipyrimidine photo-lyase
MRVPMVRVEKLNDQPIRPERRYVLYWMVAARRTRWSFGLDHAIQTARRLARPLVVFEPLRVDHPYASARFHRFVMDGMAHNHAAFARSPVRYLPYVERGPGDGRGLLEALAADACVVVTDYQPGFFLPRMQRAAAARVGALLERVDSIGMIPLAITPRAFPTAHAYRRFMQQSLTENLTAPTPDPLDALDLPGAPDLAANLRPAWAPTPAHALTDSTFLASLPIDHEVGPVAALRGGHAAARAALDRFLTCGLERYVDERLDPGADAQSGLSPYLHFGHVGVHEVFDAIARREQWSPSVLGPTKGAREGFWGMSPESEAFLDELVTWREVGHVFSHHRDDFDRYSGQPDWARASLEAHRTDPRTVRYDRDALERAETHDEIWNAAQRQLVRDGRIHNALRMLWGKKILEWSDDPEQAWDRLVYLNNRWALDGRDANSWSGIGWVLGRFDRPWGPERPIFGMIRYMSSDQARRKMRLGTYLARWGPGEPTI